MCETQDTPGRVTPSSARVQVDSAFPGANIVVERIDGQTVHLHQDWSESTGWWFYWHFRVLGAAGQTLRFQFNDGDVFAAMGPACRPDGHAWQWLGPDIVKDNGFSYQFADDEPCVYFCMCIPYVEADLRSLLATRPAIDCRTLCPSEAGRPVELLTIASNTRRFSFLATCRNHACETMGNYELEGIMDFWLANEPESAFLRQNVDLRGIPFMDKDGVEQGEQGKGRRPHDHNRDWGDQPIYASVRAVQQQVPSWPGQLMAVLDLHCPWIRGGRNEQVFMTGEPEPQESQRRAFAQILARTQQGPLRYDPANDIAHGVEWNTGLSESTSGYFGRHFAGVMAATVELPYALAGNTVVTADGARHLGRSIARALSLFIQGRVG